MKERNCLILTQYRNGDLYNDFIGKYYHFPATKSKNYLKQFKNFPIEFVYYEPEKKGKGEFYGYGKILTPPFLDKKTKGYYFVEISNYKQFSSPVYFKNRDGYVLEKLKNEKTYNYNNSVRKIDPKLLDELCLDGGIQLNFEADAHLVQVLGEQLIASERVGILELVKNAFDAGASTCDVRIEKVPELQKIPSSIYEFNQYEGPVVIVSDNGSGMTRDQIELGWLRPASTIKTNVKERLKREREQAAKAGKLTAYENLLKSIKSENKGRIPLGEKGVGRFACHRLGKNLIIRTKIKENDYEYVLKINWDDFNVYDEAYKNLDDIKVTLTRELPSRDYGVDGSGTQLIIYGGRDGFQLTDEEIREINRTILKLNTPNPSPDSQIPPFKATFSCPQIKNLDEAIIYKKYDPVLKVYGIVDDFGFFEFDYSFDPPYNIPLPSFKKSEKLDLKKIQKDTWLLLKNGKRLWRKPVCGQFYIHLDVWIRDNPWMSNADSDFKKYLEEYGGISIYRDGINVFPAEWGAETDWLGLRQRQIKQTRRMSYYHMIGNIELAQTINTDLIDKTNREGLIKNNAFRDLKDLVTSIVYYVENDYMGKRDEYKILSGDLAREPKVLGSFSTQSSKIISNINKNYDLALDSYKLFEDIKELGDISERKGKLIEISKSLSNLSDNLEQIQEVQDLLTEQAGFGLGIAVAIHEITKTTSNFYYGILEVIKTGRLNNAKLEELTDTSKVLESELLRISPLRALRNEKPILFKVSDSIKYVYSVFQRKLKALNIEFSYNDMEDFQIIARYGALNQILTNLMDNACYWLDNPEFEARRIQVKINQNERTVIFADSGPGVAESILPYLFQPGYSLKYPPSGLGLYICRHYMNLMKRRGEIYLAKEKDRIEQFSGAQFLLDFSNVNSKKSEQDETD